jgi:hypothetical protein
MKYQVVVYLSGKHLFSTDLESVPNERQMITLLGLFTEKFPVSEGYEVSVKAWKDKVTV